MKKFNSIKYINMKKFNSIREELEYITSEHDGLCNPKDVVEFAENPKTLLHDKFEWDNNKAAQEFRLGQARKIISLEVVIIDERTPESRELKLIIENDPQIKPPRKYVSLSIDRKTGNGYRDIKDVLTDPILRAQFLEDAFNELKHFQQKYRQLTELADVFAAIENLKM